MVPARWWLPLLLLCAAGPALAQQALAQQQGVNWQEAVARLAQERTRAETCARLLKRHGDAAAVDRGALAYGEAKAEYDGIVAGLGVALARREQPASLPDLEGRLRRGFERREGFCRTAQALLPPAATGEKGVLDQIVGGAVEPLVQALLAIWTRVRDEDALTRQTIQTQLEATAWPAFAALAPTP